MHSLKKVPRASIPTWTLPYHSRIRWLRLSRLMLHRWFQDLVLTLQMWMISSHRLKPLHSIPVRRPRQCLCRSLAILWLRTMKSSMSPFPMCRWEEALPSTKRICLLKEKSGTMTRHYYPSVTWLWQKITMAELRQTLNSPSRSHKAPVIPLKSN